jgi:hypothetical protein
MAVRDIAGIVLGSIGIVCGLISIVRSQRSRRP